jgi:uncharacterized protein YegL
MVITCIRKVRDILPVELENLKKRNISIIFLYGGSGRGKTYTTNQIIETNRLKVESLTAIGDSIRALRKISDRRVVATKNNSVSSREHLVIHCGDVTIVDLCGNESAKSLQIDASQDKVAWREMLRINNDLLNLKLLILSLDKAGKFVPWRNSNLNRYLQTCNWSNICCVGCVGDIIDGTDSNTLEFLKSMGHVIEMKKLPKTKKIDFSNVEISELIQTLDRAKQMLESFIQQQDYRPP